MAGKSQGVLLEVLCLDSTPPHSGEEALAAKSVFIELGGWLVAALCHPPRSFSSDLIRGSLAAWAGGAFGSSPREKGG